MLTIKEALPSKQLHNFSLSNTILEGKAVFELTSETYSDVKINFTLESEIFPIPPGYSVNVFLFKNNFFSQKDIIDLKLSPSHRIGYFFQLDALFEPDTLEMNEHIFPYAYYALNYIFSNDSNLQTKEVEITKENFKINDFFDDDSILLVLCNEYTSTIPDFSIFNYLAPLFLNGFIYFAKDNPVQLFNKSNIIQDNYTALKDSISRYGIYVLKINQPYLNIISESFVIYLFKRLVQQNRDSVTRFISNYQIIEISISKIFHLRVKEKVCDNLLLLDSEKLKEFLGDIQKEKYRINALLTDYARPSTVLERQLKEELINFFIHVQESEYLDDEENKKRSLTEVFYYYRNKLVHNYRLVHNPIIDIEITKSKMDLINELSEVLIAEIISNFSII